MNNTTKSVTGKGQKVKTVKMAKRRGRPSLFKYETYAIGTSKLYPLAKANSVCVSAFLFAKRHGVKFQSARLAKTVKITRVA